MDEAWFLPMGFVLRVRSDRPAVLAAAEDAFRGFGPAAPGAAPDLDFLLLARERGGGRLADGPFVHEARGQRVRVRGRGSFLIVDRARGLASGRVGLALLEEPATLRLELLELALQLMLSARGFLGVHGAAVVCGRRAALLRAAGGGGKTTLAYAAARGRMQVLAEDVVWIDPAHATWWGLPWWLHPRPESCELFPELAGRTPALRRGNVPKLAVAVDSIQPGSAVPRALAGPVVLVQRRPAPTASRLAALALPAALDLWHAGRAGTEEELPDYHRRVRQLLGGNAWRLDLGSDLDAALALIAELLAGIPVIACRAEPAPGAAAVEP